MKNRNQLVELVLLSLLAALIFLLGLTPLGLIPLGFCNVTLLCIPVAVGTMYLGWKRGLILGLAFGATSFVSALMHPSALVGTLMGASMPLMIVMTFLPRLCVPLVVWGVYRFLTRHIRHLPLCLALCGSLASLLSLSIYAKLISMNHPYIAVLAAVGYSLAVNTLVIWGIHTLLTRQTPERLTTAVAAACGSLTNTVLYLGLMLWFYILCGIDNATVLTAITATAGGAGPAEAIAAALICPPILAAVSKIRRQ